MEKAHCTDQELINGVRTGCPASFDEITKRYGRRIYLFILRIVKNEDDAEDILQEAYIRIYKHLREGKPLTITEGGAMTAWVNRIATNLCIDHFRKRKRMPTIVDVYSNADNVVSMIDYQNTNTGEGMDAFDALREAMTYLNDTQRTAIVMHYIQGMSLPEIAKSCSISINTAHGRIGRARRSLSFYMNILLPQIQKSLPKKRATA